MLFNRFEWSFCYLFQEENGYLIELSKDLNL